MAVTNNIYHAFVGKGYDGSDIDVVNDTIKVMALTSSYTPSQSTHDFINDASANEASGTGYTAGGYTLIGKSWSLNTGVWTFDATDISWTITSAFSARYLAIYKDTGNSATSPVIALIDLGGTFSITTGTFAVAWGASGIFAIEIT